DLRENFTSLAKLLRNRLRSEFVSLAIAREDGTMRRLTVGANRTLLDEIGLDLCAGNSHVGYVLQSGKPMFVDCLADETGLPVDDLVVAGGVRSVMALPVTCHHRPDAVLTIASSDESAYERRDQRLLESVMPIIRDLVLDDTYRRASAESERKFSLINDILAEVGETSDLRVMFQRAADTVLTELQCTMVRIATFDHDDAFLSSRAVAHDPSTAPPTPGDGHMVMSLMPLHRRVRDSGRILMVDGADAEHHLTPAEAGQAFFPEVQSAMLVPVMLGQQVLAVIGIADSHQGGRRSYRRLDILLVRSTAAILALAIQASLGRKLTGSIVENRGLDSPTMRTSQLRGRIRSSLSGILGSVEMIKSQHKPSGPALEKYLSIIDKSAQRINDCITEQVS
ncbi:MAG: GAF domain-containing protein, partial [candidate division Zixibacteria bacterium]|nr:GAF domain-containing protein [candidate division Zixibacteria bacterium]